ncbi:metallophosphoesterase [Planctomyces sp. SH-PL62]|uniref:metallophosphoesterase n=1 Tax=Planctomyces sp. SH-PL62 TaxID=1636152 RepID=UPI00078B59DC|nr:metallophosphoesterase [Planctomyces sp. SH-PL62]AMV38899.1 Calcineurin-like phosphoesterase [Planctomyces sp. SH-PL62]
MPDPKKVLAVVQKAADLSRRTPGRVGSVVRAFADEVMVVGDLHGNLRAFKWVLAEAALDQNPGRHLVLQELVHEINKNQDDRPDLSHRLVDVVCALKCQYPDRVHVILGNHELSELTGRVIGKDGRTLNERFREGIERSYGDAAEAMYGGYLKFFAAMPIAVRTPNRVFICHTIPDGDWLDGLDLSILDADVWPPEAMKRRGTVYAMTWGRDESDETVDRFAAMVDADLFVTGHQPCDEGFRQANHRQLIIDGTEPHPTYCRFPARTPIGVEDLVKSVKVMGLEPIA